MKKSKPVKRQFRKDRQKVNALSAKNSQLAKSKRQHNPAETIASNDNKYFCFVAFVE